MRAYAVFAGGGVKGAALAGALAAAQNWGFDFRGYGGTSAGSIIATLGAVGFTGKKIGELLVDKEFAEFLDDGGLQLNQLVARAKAIDFSSFCNLLRSVPPCVSVHRSVRKRHGLYNGQRLTDYLWALIRTKLGLNDDARSSFTFEYLKTIGAPDLKIVASDISLRRAAVFPRDSSRYGSDILNAVRASAGLPFAFQPVRIGESYLIDGGVASNLPIFLFGRESEETRYPTVAFDLVQERKATITGLADFLRESFFTCLEASDVLMRDATSYVFHIPIPIPSDVNTLDFHISRAAKQSLYDSAYRHTDEYFCEIPMLAKARGTVLSTKEQMMAQYGNAVLYQPVLRALIGDIEEASAARGVRANIMLHTTRLEDGVPTRLVVYQVGMDSDGDKDLEMKEDAGCSGEAWRTRRVTLADLGQAAKRPEDWVNCFTHSETFRACR